MKLIDISTPKYPNTFTMVDDEDFDWLNQWKWRMDRFGYVRRSQRKDGKMLIIYMHVEILQPPTGMIGDHRFGNKLDHRRENLRIGTYSENNMNRRPNKSRTLPKGVSWRAKERRFRAKIGVNGHKIQLGAFRTVPEAEAAYIEAAKKYHGEFARQNTITEDAK